MDEPLEAPPPFKRRYTVGRNPLPFSKPYERVPDESWHRFVDDLTPIASDIGGELTDSKSFVLSFILLAAALAFGFGYVIGYFDSMHPVVFGSILAIVFIGTVQATAYFVTRQKMRYLERLESICKTHQHEFAKCNLALECRLQCVKASSESNNLNAEDKLRQRFYLYILPTNNAQHDDGAGGKEKQQSGFIHRNGYVRIPILNIANVASFTKWGGHPMLNMYADYLPSGLENIDIQDWNSFWSTLEASTHTVATYRKLQKAGLIVFWIWLVGHHLVNLNFALDLLLFSVAIAGSIATLVFACKGNGAAEDIQKTLEESCTMFRKRHGVYAEVCFEGIGSVRKIEKYIYFFLPMKESSEPQPPVGGWNRAQLSSLSRRS